MKKIFWTTIVWIVIFVGFAFYMKMFDTNLATQASTFLGVTTITTSGEPITASGDIIVSGT
jgi:TM2 domain-containing membrane protein YozV